MIKDEPHRRHLCAKIAQNVDLYYNFPNTIPGRNLFYIISMSPAVSVLLGFHVDRRSI